MPHISIYLNDEDSEYLIEKIGKGKISSYLTKLIRADKGRVKLEEDKKTFEGILNLSLFFVGLAFILLVISTSYLPEIGSSSYVIVLLVGGTLLSLQAALKMYNGKVKKNGTDNPVSN